MRCGPLRCLAVLLLLAAAAPARADTVDLKAIGDHPPTRTLSEDEVTRYTAALEELAALGDQAQADLAAQGESATGGYPEAIVAVFERHGFTEETFVPVHWNAMLAYAAVLMEERRPRIEAALAQQRQQLEAMKDSLPPEQYAAMREGFEKAADYDAAYKDVPAANRALVAKHRASFDRVFQVVDLQ